MNIGDAFYAFGNANYDGLSGVIESLKRFSHDNICDVNDIELKTAFYDGPRRVVIDVYCYEVDEAAARQIENIALTEKKYSEFVATICLAARTVALTINYPQEFLYIDAWSWLAWDRLQVHFSEHHHGHWGHHCHTLGCSRMHR